MATIHELAQDSLEYRRQIDDLRAENEQLRKIRKEQTRALECYAYCDSGKHIVKYNNPANVGLGKCRACAEIKLLRDHIFAGIESDNAMQVAYETGPYAPERSDGKCMCTWCTDSMEILMGLKPM